MPRKVVIKTRKNEARVDDWLAGIADEARRKDCATVLRLMKKVTKAPPRMWGTSIVGFGDKVFRGASREVDWFLMGFASRKQDLTLYIMDGANSYPKLLAKLGKHKTGKGCLYLKSLADVDLGALEELMTRSYKNMRARD
jgi:hypothetical protein